MWNQPTEEQLKQIPRLYETEGTPTGEKLIYMHFFLGSCDWWIAEYDGEDIFFGFAILNGDHTNSEWGYFSLRELKSIQIGFVQIDRDLHWTTRKASEIDKIKVF